MRNDVIQAIDAARIIVVIRGVQGDELLKTAQALKDGGLSIVELPFDAANPAQDEQVAQNVEQLKAHFGSELYVGCGTVLCQKQVDLAHQCGAQLIVAPNTNAQVVAHALVNDLVAIPGAMTPGEIVAAYDAGADYVKLFPAAQLGEAYVKAVTQPLGHIKLLAFGGIGLENYKRFLINGAFGAGIASALVNERYINNSNYDIITANARQYVRHTLEYTAKSAGA